MVETIISTLLNKETGHDRETGQDTLTIKDFNILCVGYHSNIQM